MKSHYFWTGFSTIPGGVVFLPDFWTMLQLDVGPFPKLKILLASFQISLIGVYTWRGGWKRGKTLALGGPDFRPSKNRGHWGSRYTPYIFVYGCMGLVCLPTWMVEFYGIWFEMYVNMAWIYPPPSNSHLFQDYYVFSPLDFRPPRKKWWLGNSCKFTISSYTTMLEIGRVHLKWMGLERIRTISVSPRGVCFKWVLWWANDLFILHGMWFKGNDQRIKILILTIDGRNPKQPPGMVLKPCK